MGCEQNGLLELSYYNLTIQILLQLNIRALPSGLRNGFVDVSFGTLL